MTGNCGLGVSLGRSALGRRAASPRSKGTVVRRHWTLSLPYHQCLVGGHVSEPIHATAGPVNLNQVGFLMLPQSEVES